jgi:hypothetical protein
MKTTMDDELIQVKAKIATTEREWDTAKTAATKANLTEAERQRKEELVLSLTNLLVGLNQNITCIPMHISRWSSRRRKAR